ncbi:MAG: TolC family protein [Aquisalinus sp.]|nr:TolC family protein [Aquisalinus sp.]
MLPVSIAAVAVFGLPSAFASEDGPPAGSFMSYYAARSPESASVLLSRPSVRQQLSLSEGNTDQLRQALETGPVETTRPQASVDDLLYNPPDTEGMSLGLRDVLAYTLMNNPELGIVYWRLQDRVAAIRGAKAGMLPTVEVGFATGIESVTGETVASTDGLNRQEASLRVSQLLFDFGRSMLAVQRAEALYNSQEFLFRDKVAETIQATIIAYLDLMASSELLESSRQNVAVHERIYNLVLLNGEGGNATEAEVKRALTRLERARTNMIDFENQREAAISAFRRVTGLEPGRLVRPEFDMTAAYDLNEANLDYTLSQHPALQSAYRDYNSIDHQLEAAKLAYLPEFRVDLAGKYQDQVLGNTPWQQDGRVMVTATWNVYDGGLARSRKDQLVARRNEVEQQLVKVRNELRQDGYNILSVLRTSQDKTSIFETQLAASQRVVELYFLQFEAGRRTLFELLDAQADLNQAREEQITNKYENLSAGFASLRLQNRLTSTISEQFSLDLETTE